MLHQHNIAATFFGHGYAAVTGAEIQQILIDSPRRAVALQTT